MTPTTIALRTRAAVSAEPALVAISLIGVALRLAWLFQPVRYDEATTFLRYVRGGLRTVVTDYDAPNNHVFHSLLVWLSTRLSTDVWAIRLPAFVAGALVPPATYFVGRRLYGRGPALFGAALVACSAHLIEYSTNARGYSIVTLFSLLQLIFADRIVRAARHADFAAFALATSLGLFTVPTMVYPTAATLAWAVLLATTEGHLIRRLVRRTPIYVVATVGATLLLYLPILSQPNGSANLTSNRFVAPLRSFDAWRGAMNALGGQLVDEWSLGPTRIGLALLAALALFAIARRRDARSSWPLVATVVVLTMLLLQRVAPFARVFCFALPMLSLAGSAGLADALRATRSMPAFSVAACAAMATHVVVARLPDRSAEADKFPDAAVVVAFLTPKIDAGDAVIAGGVPSAPMQYTLFREGRPPFAYRAGATRLWIVTRSDGSAAEALSSRVNRLNAADFATPRLAFQSGIARVYEAVPHDGRTPKPAKVGGDQGARNAR